MKIKSPLKTILFSLLLCAWAAFTSIASQFIVAFPMVLLLGKETIKQPVWTTVYTALAYILAMFLTISIPIFIKKRRNKKHPEPTAPPQKSTEISTREQLGLKDLPTFSDIGLAPVAFIVYLIIAAATVFLMNNFPWFNASEAQDVGFSNLAPGLDRCVAFIALVICAPIAEEIIFRGWLYGKLRNRLPLIPAILLVSTLFGVLHGQWNVGVNVFVMSIVLCLQREITGTIYSGILLHMIKNGVAFYLLFILGIS